jgi:hypothetical protein
MDRAHGVVIGVLLAHRLLRFLKKFEVWAERSLGTPATETRRLGRPGHWCALQAPPEHDYSQVPGHAHYALSRHFCDNHIDISMNLSLGIHVTASITFWLPAPSALLSDVASMVTGLTLTGDWNSVLPEILVPTPVAALRSTCARGAPWSGDHAEQILAALRACTTSAGVAALQTPASKRTSSHPSDY